MKLNEWHKAKASNNNGSCVEVMETEDGAFLLRDTKDGTDGYAHRFTSAEWRAFLAGVRAGEFDPAE
jgi:hypothetical protein